MRHKIALVMHMIVAVGYLGMGAVYYSLGRVLPYHEQALGAPWESLSEPVQLIIVSFMRGGASACVAMALLMGLILLIPARRGERWARIGVPIAGMIGTGLFLAPILQILAQTDASPPWPVIVLAFLLNLVGLALSH